MNRRAWAAFAAVSFLWGIPYLFIKIAVDHGATPSFVAFGRVALAAAVLLPFAAHAGALRGLRDRWKALVGFAVLEVSIPFPLIAFGEQHVSSSLTAILIATVPLTVALLAMRFDHSERVTGWRLGGLFLGLAGVVLLFGIDIAGSTDEVVGAIAILISVVGYSAGPLIVKRYLSDVDPIGPVAAALAISTVMLAPFAVLDAPSTTPDASALWSIVVLGLASTAAAFILMFILIAEAGASRASIITYVNPVVAVALGVTLLDESLGLASIAGLALILAGSWLATRSAAAAAPEPVPAR